MHIKFVNEGIIKEAEAGTILSDVFASAGIFLRKDCGGQGICGKCLTDIIADGKREQVKACSYQIASDVEVITVKGNQQSVSILTESSAQIDFLPCLHKEYVKFDMVSEGSYLKRCSLNLLRTVSQWAAKGQNEGFTAVIKGDEIIDVQLGDTTKALYGAAVDIGTTTVVLYLYDLNDGSVAGVYSALNAQSACGADVISRISWSESHDGSEALKNMLTDTINSLLSQALAERKDIEFNLYEIILCGNSAMQHMFFGMETYRLGISPFICITKDFIRCSANDAGLVNCPERCQVTFLPLIGGFVGADTLAVLLSLRDLGGTMLMIDLGTNGELAVGSKSKWLTASAACGPALEGGGLSCGMMAAKGAINRIKLSYNQVKLSVIGGGAPSGICGSGIISCIAEMRRFGLIDHTGHLIDSDECSVVMPGSLLKLRLREKDGVSVFVLWEGDHSIYITQQDIRQVQMAKSAIYSGCKTVIKQMGADMSDIEYIVLAGAFGNYIDADDAIYIGLLPEVNRDKIVLAGNAAGAGASMYLLDKQARVWTDELKTGVRHLELANDKNFISEYTKNMNFN